MFLFNYLGYIVRWKGSEDFVDERGWYIVFLVCGY